MFLSSSSLSFFFSSISFLIFSNSFSFSFISSSSFFNSVFSSSINSLFLSVFLSFLFLILFSYFSLFFLFYQKAHGREDPRHQGGGPDRLHGRKRVVRRPFEFYGALYQPRPCPGRICPRKEEGEIRSLALFARGARRIRRG